MVRMKTRIMITVLLLFILSVTACSRGAGGRSAVPAEGGEQQENPREDGQENPREDGQGNSREDGQGNSREDGQNSPREDGQGNSQNSGQGSSPEGKISTDPVDSVCGAYFKSGDFTYRMKIKPGGPDEPEGLRMLFAKRDTQFSNAFSELCEFALGDQEEDGLLHLKDVGINSDGSEYIVDWKRGGPVSLLGETEGEGTYYPEQGNLILPEAFERPLNSTDLIGLEKEEIRLVRNQFYAVYGREFKDETLKRYFEDQPWYEGHIPADRFNELVLGGLERRNISFLKDAEEGYDQDRAKAVSDAYDALSPVPYLNLLPEHGEIYVEMLSEQEHAADRGLYYEAEGSISVPITISLVQYAELEKGREVELQRDGITGEKALLKKAVYTDYGDYVLMNPENHKEEEGRAVNLSYEPYTRTFSMWADSVDTLFKKVYEGSVYVLKGACEEYYNYFNLPEKSRPEGAGAFRMMDFHETSSGGPTPYSGNILVTDSKGYVKALYFMGD